MLYCVRVAQKEKARQDLEVKVRGKGCPPVVETWEHCGFSERVLAVIRRNKFDVSHSTVLISEGGSATARKLRVEYAHGTDASMSRSAFESISSRHHKMRRGIDSN